MVTEEQASGAGSRVRQDARALLASKPTTYNASVGYLRPRRDVIARRKPSFDARAGQRKPRKSLFVAVGALALSGLALFGLKHDGTDDPPVAPPPVVPRDGQPYGAFSPDSWWNTPLPANVPLDPAGSQILDYMRTAAGSGQGCLMFAGAGDGKWGQPIYWAKPSDPSYDVQGVATSRPSELDHLRIPVRAEPASNNDGTMSIYDLGEGYVTALTDAAYDPASDTWTASGATVTYLHSNGLNVATGRSDEPRNVGTHRGNNGATMAVSWDMVQAGAIRHVLKVALGPEVADRYVFPMVGSDGHYTGTDAGVPPQGLRLRIKPSIDLEALHLNPESLIIALALQQYGFYVGDSGGTTALKLENTVAEGRGQLWDLAANDLCGLPFTAAYWDVVQEGYDPTR